MATLVPVFGAKVTMTINPQSMANAAALNVGRESSSINQKADPQMDCMVGGSFMTGTSPLAGKQIEVWAYASWDDGVGYSGGMTGTATGAAATSTPTDKGLFQLLKVIATDNTSNKAYAFGPCSIAEAFGGFVPSRWGIWITQNTNVALNATAGNHRLEYFPMKLQSS